MVELERLGTREGERTVAAERMVVRPRRRLPRARACC